MRLAEAYIDIRANRKPLQVGLAQSKTDLSRTLKGMGSMVSKVAPILGLAGIGTAFGLAVRSMISTAGGFEQAMANVRSVAGATSSELTQLTDHAREMGKVSIFSARQAADGMYYLASAGMKTNEIMGALKGTLDLAAATQSELASTTETVAATISAFGLRAEESERVANTFAATISATQATMGKLSASMGYIGPIARSVGMSLEETTAILGNLYNAGIDASTAGTSLRQAFANLLDPTEDTITTLDRLGIALKTDEGRLRPFTDIIRDLEDVGLEAADALKIFGVRAGPGMLALVNKGADAIENLTERVTDTKKASEMAAMQTDTFQGSVKLLRSAMQELTLVIGDSLLPALKALNETLIPFINRFSLLLKYAGGSDGDLGVAIRNIHALNEAFGETDKTVQGLMKYLFTPFEVFRKPLQQFTSEVVDLGSAVKEVSATTTNYKSVTEALLDPLGTALKLLKDSNFYWDQQWKTLKAVNEAYKDLKSGMSEAAAILPDYMPKSWLEAHQAENKALRESVKGVEDYKGKIGEMISYRGRLLHQQQEMIGYQGDEANMLKLLSREITDYGEAAGRVLVEEVKRIQDVGIGLEELSTQSKAFSRGWTQVNWEFLDSLKTMAIDWARFEQNLVRGFANVFENFGHEMLNFKEIWKWNLDDIGAYFDHALDSMLDAVKSFAGAFRDAIIRAAAEALASEALAGLKAVISAITEALAQRRAGREDRWVTGGGGGGDITIGVGGSFRRGGIVRRPRWPIAEGGAMAAPSPRATGITPRRQGAAGNVVIENLSITASFPNADMEHLDSGTLARVFRTQFPKAIEDLAREGIINPAVIA